MTLYTFTISGRIRNGKLEVELPPDAVEGQVEVQISLLEDVPPPSVTSETWELLKPEPKSGSESIALGHMGGWEDEGIVDSLQWKAEQRKKREDKNRW